MRILLTGGCGFIGSNLALATKSKWPDAEVVSMDNLYRRGAELNVPRLREAGIAFARGDVREPATFPAGPFDFVIECSAEPSVLAGQDGALDYAFQTNLTGAYHCVEKAREWNAGLLFLSTSRVYPIATLEKHPWIEQPTRFAWQNDTAPGLSARGVSESLDMTGARSLYGFTKLAAEQLIEEYRSAFGLRAVINRCGVIAGPWQFGKVDQGVAALWVMAHHFSRPLSYIGYGGQGKQVRDFLHVADLCDLVLEQLEDFGSWEGWVGNVSGGLANSASLRELTEMCQEIVGHRTEIGSNPTNRAADLRLFIGDSSRLLARTSWRPKHDVRTILADTHRWVLEHQSALASIGAH